MAEWKSLGFVNVNPKGTAISIATALSLTGPYFVRDFKLTARKSGAVSNVGNEAYVGRSTLNVGTSTGILKVVPPEGSYQPGEQAGSTAWDLTKYWVDTDTDADGFLVEVLA